MPSRIPASIAIAGASVFAIFLFLTFFMQQNLGYSPMKTGVAFLSWLNGHYLREADNAGSGVPRDADDTALKKAYRNLARAYHPDPASRR